MDAQSIKEYIFENELIEDILINLNCHHIKHKNGFFTCGNPDGGDNPGAIVVYENENLTTIDYTRQLVKQPRATDIFDLISFFEDLTFPETLRWCCNLFGLNLYEEPEDEPESLQILKMLKNMQTEGEQEDTTPLQPIPEEILSYYLPYGNQMFEDDNISLEIQQEFRIGYDPRSNRITIPLRDSLGELCGVKGRLFGEPDEDNPKYLFLEKCAKSKLIYGYYENREYIKSSPVIYCGEAEKFVLQCASYGYRNAISLGGKSISKTQIELLVRTGCKICLALDKDVQEEELQSIANKFPEGVPVYAIIDRDNLLDEKESPSDDINKFIKLIKNNIYQIK